MAQGHPHTTSVGVYPALLRFDTVVFSFFSQRRGRSSVEDRGNFVRVCEERIQFINCAVSQLRTLLLDDCLMITVH